MKQNTKQLDELLAMTLADITGTPGKIFSTIIQTAKNQGSLRPEKKQIIQLSGLEITDENVRKNLQKINKALNEVAKNNKIKTPANIKSRGDFLEITLGDFVSSQTDRRIEAPSKAIESNKNNIAPQATSDKTSVSIFISHAWENNPKLNAIVDKFYQALTNKLTHLPEQV